MTRGGSIMSEPTDESEWVVTAPGAGEITLAVGVGEGAELTDEARLALESLIEALHEADVSGFALRGSRSLRFAGFNLSGAISLAGSTCEKLTCTGHSCNNLSCNSYKSAFQARL